MAAAAGLLHMAAEVMQKYAAALGVWYWLSSLCYNLRPSSLQIMSGGRLAAILFSLCFAAIVDSIAILPEASCKVPKRILK